MQNRFYLYALIVAVAGLCAAGLIYVTAGDDTMGAEDFKTVVVDGKVYQIPLAENKMYRRELQRFGGKASVLFDEIDRWFAGLWRGKSLAVTVVWITGFIAFVLFLIARRLSFEPESDVQDEHHQNKAG